MSCVFDPFDQEYVYDPDGVTVTSMTPFCEVHEVTGLTFPERVILELPLFTVTLPVPVHPPLAVTVTE